MNLPSEQLLSELGEDFVARLRRGESPSVSEYSNKYPVKQAEEIEEFLESIAMLEDLKRCEAPSAKRSDILPEVFGRYRIERSLGEGGMGTVYLAHDSQLNRKVALKTPKFGETADSTLIDRFYREARSAATLQHPNICPVHDIGEIDGVHYISMAYIEGRPLEHYIKSKKPPPVASAARVVRKVAIALHEAHSHGVVHRDLKPANIMIDRHSEPIVMDFGLAKQFGLDESEESEVTLGGVAAPSPKTKVAARLTQYGTLIGSPGYMSPEQILGERDLIGPTSDIYALGVLLYELLTGELPFPGDGSFMSIAKAVVGSDPPDPTVIRRDLAPQIKVICQKAMAKDGADRYTSMLMFAAALTDYLKSEMEKPSNSLSEVGNKETPELVRSKEQCDLARSLYHEGQYAASLSILEKMVDSSDTRSNQYTIWAKSELQKARAEQASRESIAANEESDEDFWAQEFGDLAAGTHSDGQPHTLGIQTRSQQRSSARWWVFGVVTVTIVIVGWVIAAIITSRLLGDIANDQSVPQPGAGSTSQAASGKAPGSAASRNNRVSPVDRVWRFDTNGDRAISKAELSANRLPQAGPMRRVADNFDNFDQSPPDGVLDEGEIRHIRETLFRPTGREDRGPGGRARPRR